MSNDPEQILRASMQDFGESRSSSRSSHRTDRTSHTSSKYDSPQHCSSGGSHNWESLMGISDHPSAYKKGGAVKELAHFTKTEMDVLNPRLVKDVTTQNRTLAAKGQGIGPNKDTKIGQIKNERIAKALDTLIHQGHKQVNPKTGLREYNETKYWLFKNRMPKLKEKAGELGDHPNNAMAKFLDVKHAKSLNKLNYLNANNALIDNQGNALTPEGRQAQIDKLTWKTGAGMDEHRISRAAKNAIRYASNPEHKSLIGLHEMFEGKKNFMPSTGSTTEKRNDKHYNPNNDTLENNIKILKDHLNKQIKKNSVHGIFMDENAITGSKTHRNSVDPNIIERYERPELTKHQLKKAAMDASSSSKGDVLVSLNGQTYKNLGKKNALGVIQEHNKGLKENKSVGEKPKGFTFPGKQVQNSTYLAFNGVNIGKYRKKEAWNEVAKDKRGKDGEIFQPGEGKFLLSKKLSEPIKKYLENKIGSTTCMEANYRTHDNPPPIHFESYPKTKLHFMTADSVDKQLSENNIRNKIQGNPMEEQIRAGHKQTPGDHNFGPVDPNSIGIVSDTSINNHIADNHNHALYVSPYDQSSNKTVRPFTKVSKDGTVTQPTLHTDFNEINGIPEKINFVSPQQPLKYDAPYGNGTRIAPNVKIPRRKLFD